MQASSTTGVSIGVGLVVLWLGGCGMSADKQHAIINGAAVGAITGGAVGCASAAIADSNNPEAYEIGCPVGVGVGAIVGGVVAAETYREPVAAAAVPVAAPAERIVLRGVRFDFDKASLRPDARPILDEATEVLKAHRDLAIEVNGYTDSVGSQAYNLKLSQRRAAAVAAYLEQSGISSTRLITHGYGANGFVASNATPAGRAENRRVELVPGNHVAGRG